MLSVKVRAEIVYMGGGYAQNNKEFNAKKFLDYMMSSNPPFYGDDEYDHYQVELGIDFAMKYPLD